LTLTGTVDPSADYARRQDEAEYVFDSDLLVPHLHSNSKIGAIKELVDRLHQRGVIADSLPFLQAVLERENLQSTILADEVALPHARCPSVRRLGVAVGLAQPPLEYPSGDELREIPVICLIAVPAGSAGLYLSLMANLARRLRVPAVRAELQAADTAAEIQELLSLPDCC
jgi:fructose PTS system EIIBC or EIIC component